MILHTYKTLVRENTLIKRVNDYLRLSYSINKEHLFSRDMFKIFMIYFLVTIICLYIYFLWVPPLLIYIFANVTNPVYLLIILFFFFLLLSFLPELVVKIITLRNYVR